MATYTITIADDENNPGKIDISCAGDIDLNSQAFNLLMEVKEALPELIKKSNFNFTNQNLQ